MHAHRKCGCDQPALVCVLSHQREEGRDAQPSALALICGGTMDGLRAHCEYSLKVHGCNMGAAAAIGSCRTAWAVVRFGPRQQISRTKVLHAQSIASPSILKPDGVGSNTSPLWCPINLFGSYGAFPYSWHICICLGKRAQGRRACPDSCRAVGGDAIWKLACTTEKQEHQVPATHVLKDSHGNS